ncbi:MAG: hypothetical protein AAFN70_20320, partial [Planctomycetota bacterium]
AASVLFAGFVTKQLYFPGDDDKSVNTLADLSVEEGPKSGDDVMPAPLPPTDVPGENAVNHSMVAEAGSDPASSSSANPVTEIAAANPGESPKTAPEDVEVMPPSGGNNLLADVSDSAPQGDPAMDSSTVAAVKPQQMLMVLQVRLTEEGRRTKVFESNLETVGITEGEARRVGQEFATAARSNQVKDADADASSNRVLLVESPVKKLDLLVNRLVTDRKCVKSIGFSLITAETADGAALLEPLRSIGKIDPTQVRHEGAMFPLESESDEWMESWSEDLSNRFAIPFSDDRENSLSLSAGNTGGPDPVSRILVVIR